MSSVTPSLPARDAPDAFTPPYAPAWANRLTRAVEKLPGVVWLYYGGLFLLLAVITTVIQWSAGAYPVGTLNAFHLLLAAGIPYMLAMIHYLTRAADAAMENFRPLLNASPLEFQDLHYRLTVLPARANLLWIIGFLALTFASVYFNPALLPGMQIAMTPLSIGWNILLVVLWDVVGATWFYQVYRQMRMVNRIYTNHAQVDLFNQNALYGFSGLLARAALGIIVGITVLFLIAEWMFEDVLSVASMSLGLFLAAAIFLLPLLRMHARLTMEKERLLGETGKRIEQILNVLHRQVDAQDAEGAAQTKEMLTAMEVEQRLLENIPTWPWSSETIRLLISALLFPIVLFALQFVIQKMIAP